MNEKSQENPYSTCYFDFRDRNLYEAPRVKRFFRETFRSLLPDRRRQSSHGRASADWQWQRATRKNDLWLTEAEKARDFGFSDTSDRSGSKFDPLIQGGAPRLCDARRINLYPVGLKPEPRSLMQHCEGRRGSKEDGTHMTVRALGLPA